MTKRKATKKDAPKPVELAPVDEPARTQEEQEAPPTPQECRISYDAKGRISGVIEKLLAVDENA
jgi:hypothetical protein